MKISMNKRKNALIVIAILLTISSIIAIDYHKFLDNKNSKTYYNENIKEYLANNELDYVYVSDIPFKNATTAWGQIFRDITASNTPITVKIDHSNFTFDKGIWAHATSTIDIDLTNYKDYAYFTTFYGVNETSGNNGNGVKFYIYTSSDGQNWNLKTPENPEALKSSDAAKFAKIDIRDANYLRLYANDNGAQGNDHSVWADAKLIKETYKEENYTKTVEEYDAEIKNYPNKEISENKKGLTDFEKLLLQRELVNNVGQYTINAFAKESKENQETLDWLMNGDNGENLRLYILGGAPDGSYYKSLVELRRLLEAYKSDFDNNTVTKFGTRLGDLYKKMVITLSLTHSTDVGLWMNPNVPENQSDSVERYRLFKYMHANNYFVVSNNQDHTGWFERLNIEDMRFVLNNIIDDEEILWLHDYTQARIDANPGKEETYLQPHPYMKYIWPDYSKPEYYDPTKLDHWDSLYGNFHSKYNITYKDGVQKLWMNIDNGAVCGGISKIGSNIRGVHGTPSSVISQPGHAALIYYREYAEGKGYWTIDNDVSGWALSGKTERLSLRMPLGFGDGPYVTGWPDTYIVLAQEALNDYENYEKSEKYIALANVYNDDLAKKEEYIEKALQTQNINIDAWWELIKIYKADPSKTTSDYYHLAERIGEALMPFPLPMTNLMDQLKDKFTDVKDNFRFTILETNLLTEGLTYNSTDRVYQPSITRTMANYLLGQMDTTLASFSFDGEDANKLVLSSKFDDAGFRFDYNIDGDLQNKNSWHEVTFTADEDHKHLLTEEEVNRLSADKDIYVHIIGTDYSAENLYKIDIEKFIIPDDTLYANDLENQVIGIDEHYEWRMKGDNEWTSYATASPTLLGDHIIEIRKGATGTYLPSDTKEFTFTEDNQTLTEKYVPISKLSVESFSTEASGQGRYAKNALDGNLYTHWHSDWGGNDKEKYIVIKIDKPVYLTALEYVPRPGTSANGRVREALIEVSKDGEHWEIAANPNDWANDTNSKKVSFDPVEAQYVRLTGVKTEASFITASMINLYQDATKITAPTASIAFDTTSPTKDNVVARLVNESRKITITSEGGDTHTFTENGDFTFEFKDENGLEGSATAVVDWIDRQAPEVTEVKYSTKNPTNQEVLAIISFSEKVSILENSAHLEEHNDGTHTLTFDKNDTVTIKFTDDAGNENSKTINVNWIDKEAPIGTFTYNIRQSTTEPVVATLKFESLDEKVTILNNGGNNTYTFTENGDFTFEFKDQAGNYGTATAQVNWITEKPQNNEEENQKPTTNPSTSTPSQSDTANNSITNNNSTTSQNVTTNETVTNSSNKTTTSTTTSKTKTNKNNSSNKTNSTNNTNKTETNTNVTESDDDNTTVENVPSTNNSSQNETNKSKENIQEETTTLDSQENNNENQFNKTLVLGTLSAIILGIGIYIFKFKK